MDASSSRDTTHPTPVRPATRTDVGTIATTLASAFAEDPALLWTLGDVADPERRLRHAFAAMARANLGVAGHHVAVTFDGGAAVMWRDVDCWKSSTLHSLRTLPAMIRTFRGGTVRLLRAFAMMERHHPTEPHYYLEVLGTHADHQGRGLGGHALAPMLECCDRDGVPAYTESSNPKNLSFYFRHGFERMGDELRLTDDAPPLFPLWREPR